MSRSLNVLSSFLTQISKEYGCKILKKWFGKSIAKPKAKYREIAIIEEVLKTSKPKRCLEWGSGFSTLYFPKFLGEGASWISIEHDPEWAKRVTEMNRNSNVTVHHIPPDHFPWTDEHHDGAYSDFKNYIEFPGRFGPFDFIFVDGRGRVDCLKKAGELLTKEGIVILHDANRVYYHAAFPLFKHQVLFTDPRTRGGVWVGSPSVNISDVFDVDKHQKLYRIYNRFGGLLHV